MEVKLLQTPNLEILQVLIFLLLSQGKLAMDRELLIENK